MGKNRGRIMKKDEKISQFMEHFLTMPDFVSLRFAFGGEIDETYYFSAEKTADESYKLYDEFVEKYGERDVYDFTIQNNPHDISEIGVVIYCEGR